MVQNGLGDLAGVAVPSTVDLGVRNRVDSVQLALGRSLVGRSTRGDDRGSLTPAGITRVDRLLLAGKGVAVGTDPAVDPGFGLVRVNADDKGVSLSSVLPGDPVEVSADRRALKQIALNLLSNAVKFTPRDGAITVTVEAMRP